MVERAFLVGLMVVCGCTDTLVVDTVRVRPLLEVPGLSVPPVLNCEEHVSFTRNADSGAEAGLIDGPTGRSFYSYRPSERNLPDDPLLVVYNGNAPVSAVMLGGGTGPSTVVRDGLPLESVEENSASWTRFAHVLYLDLPGSGYGYGLRGGLRASATGDEAANNLINLIKFLDCRAPRSDMPVVLVGESQGGARVSRMLWLAQHGGFGPGGPHSEWDEEYNELFEDLLDDHFRGIASVRSEPLEEIRRRQFFAKVQIQPALPTGARWGADRVSQEEFDPSFPRASTEGFEGPTDARPVAAIIDGAEAMALLGVDLANIEWLHPSFRENAIRSSDEAPAQDHFLEAQLGPLADGDFYYDLDIFGGAVGGPEESNSLWVDNARDANVLVTDALRDDRVLSPGLFSILQSEGHILSWEWMDGVEEAMMVTLDGESITVSMPRFDARHVVAFDTADALADALEVWLANLYN